MRTLALAVALLAAAPVAAQFTVVDLGPGTTDCGSVCTAGWFCLDTNGSASARVKMCVATDTWADMVETTTVVATDVSCTNCVTLTTETVGNYAAGDAEAGNALTGDTATAFFSAGQLEAARGGTGISTAASTGLARVDAGTWSVAELSGDVATSGSNATTIQANSVALTTDTAGNYVASVATANALTGGAAGSEGAVISLDLTTSPASAATVVGTGRTLTGGAGIAALGDLSADRTVATASGEADFLANGALTCGAGTRGKMQIHTTPLQYCDNAATPALQYAAYGDSSGNATGVACSDCVALTTETSGNYAAGDAEAGNALTGDTATAFFSAGQIERARGGTAADTSAYGDGLIGSDSGNTTIDVDTEAEIETALGALDVVTVTASDITSANLRTILSDETGTGAAVFVGCTDCLGTTEIADSYVLNTGDAITGDLDFNDGSGASPKGTWTPQTGTAWSVYVEDTGDDLQIESNTASTETIDIVNAGAGVVDVTIDGDLTVSGDDLVMGTNTSGFVLVADGTNFNPVDASGDVDVSSAGAMTIQANSVALTTDTTGNYAAGDAEAGNATGLACASACVTTGEVDGTLTASNLAATLTFADADFVDLSAINDSAATEGLKLPQSSTSGSGTADGQIHWDSTADKLYVGDGSAVRQVDGQPSTIQFDSGRVATTAGPATNSPATSTVFAGSNAYHGTQTSTISFRYYRSSGTGTCSIRLQDLTNSLTICSGSTTATSTTTIVSCTSPTNIPTGEAVIEVQVTVSSGDACSYGGGYWLIE